MTEQYTIDKIAGTSIKKQLDSVVSEMGARQLHQVVIRCRECDEAEEFGQVDIGSDIFVMRHTDDTGHLEYDVGLDVVDPLKQIDVAIELNT